MHYQAIEERKLDFLLNSIDYMGSQISPVSFLKGYYFALLDLNAASAEKEFALAWLDTVSIPD